MSVACGKGSLRSKSSSLMMDVNYSSMIFLVGVKEEGGKLSLVMMNLDSISQATIDVVSCECKTHCCNGGVNAIKYHCIAHSPAKWDSNTIR